MTRKHNAERGALTAAQEERWKRETAERQARYNKGLRGLIDRFTGHHKRIKEQNERETRDAMMRDRHEKDSLIFQKLEQRRTLQARQQREMQRRQQDQMRQSQQRQQQQQLRRQQQQLLQQKQLQQQQKQVPQTRQQTQAQQRPIQQQNLLRQQQLTKQKQSATRQKLKKLNRLKAVKERKKRTWQKKKIDQPQRPHYSLHAVVLQIYPQVEVAKNSPAGCTITDGGVDIRLNTMYQKSDAELLGKTEVVPKNIIG